MKVRILKTPLNLFASGGKFAGLHTNGADFLTPGNYREINTGGTHEENSNLGVPQGVDSNGTPNLVEENEVVYNDYVFSNRLRVPDKKLLESELKQNELNKGEVTLRAWEIRILRLYAGMTYADAAKKAYKEVEERPQDPISKRGIDVILGVLANSLEKQREIKNHEEASEELSSMSDKEFNEAKQQEELAQLELAMQQLAMMELQALQLQALLLMLQMSPEEQAMMLQLMQQLAMQLLMLPQMACGGKLHADGGELVDESMLGIEEPYEEMNLEPQGNPFDNVDPTELSTSELNNTIDLIIQYAKDNKLRDILKSARKAKRGSRDDKEAFVEDAVDEILMIESERLELQEQLNIEAQELISPEEEAAVQQLLLQEQLAMLEQMVAQLEADLQPYNPNAEAMAAQELNAQLMADGGDLNTVNRYDYGDFLKKFNILKYLEDIASGNYTKRATSSNIPYTPNRLKQAREIEAGDAFKEFWEEVNKHPEMWDSDEFRDIRDALTKASGKSNVEAQQAYKWAMKNHELGYFHTPLEYISTDTPVAPTRTTETTSAAHEYPNPNSPIAPANQSVIVASPWNSNGEIKPVEDKKTRHLLRLSNGDTLEIPEDKINIYLYLTGLDVIDGDLTSKYYRMKGLEGTDNLPWPKYSNWPNALGIGIQGLGLLHNVVAPNKELLNAKAVMSSIGSEGEMNPSYIGDYAPYIPLDINYNTIPLLGASAGSRRSLANLAAGNSGMASANILASDYNTIGHLGDLARTALEYNYNNLLKSLEFNKDTNKFNAQAEMNAEEANLRNRLQDLQARISATALMNQAIQNRENGIANALGNIGAGILDWYLNRYLNKLLAAINNNNGRPGSKYEGLEYDENGKPKWVAKGGKIKTRNKKRRGYTL